MIKIYKIEEFVPCEKTMAFLLEKLAKVTKTDTAQAIIRAEITKGLLRKNPHTQLGRGKSSPLPSFLTEGQ